MSISRYRPQSLQHPGAPLSVVSSSPLCWGMACWPSARGLLPVLCCTAHRCWTSEFMMVSGSCRVELSPFKVILDGIFPREWLNCLSLSVQVADTCSPDRLLIPSLWGRKEGSMISPMFWRGLISLRRSQKTAFSGSKLCQFCKSSHA